MLLPDYEYYYERGGELSEDEFSAVVRDAGYTVSLLTFGRSEEPPERMADRVKTCICEIADIKHSFKETDSQIPKGVSSINNDGYSVTRDSSSSARSETQMCEEVCRKYLTMPINLMYSGVC